MSQICKFYAKGSCKYGDRCRYLHVDPYDADYSNDRRSSQQYSYRNEKYSQDHGYTHQSRHTHQTHDSRHHNHSRSNYGNDSYAAQQNYNRYHVDHRQNQRGQIDSESISPAEFLEIVKMEVIEHEKSQMWPFTVMAPVKHFGNIPGFKDLSPEEVRFEYVESMSANTLYDFDRNMRHAQNELSECRKLFLSNSSQAYNILKNMLEGSKNAKTNDATASFGASAFSFDLSKLNANQLPVSEDMNTESGPSLSTNLFQNANPLNHQGNAQGFSNSGTGNHSFMGNPTSTFSFANLPRQSDSQISTFSFNMSTIKSSQENPIQSSVFQSQPGSTPNINDSIYSDLGQLPPESIEQFKAKIFKPGKIPLSPPPRELCIS